MSPPMTPPAYKRTAIHEVGHAVIAVLLGRQVVRVQLGPHPSTNLKRKRILPKGRPKTPADRAHLEGELMLVVAGIAAERAMAMANRTSIAGALDDLRKATDLAVQLAGPARAEATLANILATTERMLQRRTDTIRAAADVLMQQGVLTADDVQRLIPRR